MKHFLNILFFCLFISNFLNAQTVPEPERVRTYDVLHYNISVTPDITQKKITGTVIGQFVPIDNNFDILELDGVALKIFSVKINGAEVNSYTNTGKKIEIMLDKVYSTNDTITYEISYECFPQRGFYFVHPTELDPSHPYQFWTQGEGEDNKHWIPIYDYPNDKSTTEIYVTIDENFKTISNGYLAETLVAESTGKKTDHWVMDKPHVSYLIMLGGGD
jgi:aminopeptidase N